MTAPDRRLDRAGETAQIVLVGAVAMAFIIVGLVVVANTVLYSESVGSEGSLSSADETAEFQGIARDSAASTVYRVNERNDFSTNGAGQDALDDAVRNNIVNLSNLLATEYGQEYGVFVDIEPDLANSEYGARIEQDTETFFNNSDGAGDTWNPVDSSTTVAEFEASFNVSEMSPPSLLSDPFRMRLEGSGGDVRFLTFYNQSGDLAIDSANSRISLGSITPDCTVSTGEFVLVDISNGSVPGTDCTFDSLDSLEGPYTVEFEDGDAAVGTYSFVVENYAVGDQSKYANAGGGQPYSSTVYWSIAADITYEGTEVGYELSRDIPIYTRGADVSVAPWLASPASVFFSDGSTVAVARGNGSDPVSLTPGLNAEALGPVTTDLTGDGRIDIPYVTPGDELVLTNDTNDTTTLATSGDISGTIESSKTRLAVDRWDGSPTSVFFVNENHDTIYRVAPGGSPQVVSTPGNGAQAVLGTGDIDGDGDEELLFADDSQTLRYINPDGSIEGVSNGGVGSNNGIGSGSIADFDDDGTDVLVTVDGSNNVVIVGDAVSNTKLTSTAAKKAPVTIADVDLDGDNEIVYVGADDGKLKYVDDVRGSNTIKFLRDADGDKIDADDGVGVT
mgnify:CR=1 FL=1